MKTKLKEKGSILLIIILLISLLLNTYQYLRRNKAEKVINEYRYGKTEEIRYTNESIINTLNVCIEVGKITNEDLITLYKNYNVIAMNETELIQSYIEYNLGFRLIFEEKVDVSSLENINRIYWDIEELIYNHIIDDLRSNVAEVELTEKTLTDFNTMLDLAKDLKKCYADFDEENYKDLNEEKRAKKMKEDNAWFEILKEIQKTAQKYVDYPFIYGVQQIESDSSEATE